MYEITTCDQEGYEETLTCKAYSVLVDSRILWMQLSDDILRYIPIEELKVFDVKEVK